MEEKKLEAVYGVSKKTGKPYKALRLTVPTIDGKTITYFVFPRSYEWRLMGISDEDFIHIG